MNFKPEFRILSDDQIYDIHQAALDLLWKTGVSVKSKEACNLLRKAGARVDGETMLCRIPGYIIEESLKRAPSAFTIYARNPAKNVRVSTKALHYEPMIGRMNVYDCNTKRTHLMTLKDVGELVKLADAMPNYQLLHSGAIMPRIADVPIRATHVYGYLQSVRNSSKVIKATSRERIMAEDCLRMVAAVAGSEDELRNKPYTFTTANPVTPLLHDRDQLEGALLYAKWGQPIDVTSEPQAGATAPVTLAGLLTQQTADVISGITIIQLLNPGNPVWFGTCGSIMDLRLGRIAMGAVEMGMINVATAQLAHFYNIPCRGTALATDSKLLDMQAGYEKATILTMAALGGVNKIFYAGTMEGAMTVSKESLVIDNEIIGGLYRVLDGIDVNEETLAVKVIDRVGPGGHFLSQRHTMKFLKKGAHFLPSISDRRTRDKWGEAGSKDTVQRAHEKVEEILAAHQVDPLDAGVEAELERIVREVDEREAGR